MRCFLSQDGLPIISHDSNIYDQMTAVRRDLFGKKRMSIRDMSSRDLIKTSRSDPKGGRNDLSTAFFMSNRFAINGTSCGC